MAGLGDQNGGSWGQFPGTGDMDVTVDLNALKSGYGPGSEWEQTMAAPGSRSTPGQNQGGFNNMNAEQGNWNVPGRNPAGAGGQAPPPGVRNTPGQNPNAWGNPNQNQGDWGNPNQNQGVWGNPNQNPGDYRAGGAEFGGPGQTAAGWGGSSRNPGGFGTAGAGNNTGRTGTGRNNTRRTSTGGKHRGKGSGGRRGGGMGPVRIIVLIAALGVFAFAAFRLGSMLLDYKAANDQYNSITESYSATPTPGPTPTPATVNPSVVTNAEDATPPKVIDWGALRAKNPDVVGWIYMNVPGGTIDYPIVQGDDNDEYLHTGFDGNYLYAGSIFMDSYNSRDFSDGNTIVYGHNMKNKSMFARLRDIREADYQSDPYFWILTPAGDYRYHIYSIADVDIDNDVYYLFRGYEADFLDWEKKIQGQSMYQNNVQFEAGDHTVTLSTCTESGSRRRVVVGKCVSTARPSVNSLPTGAETVGEDGVPIE